MRRMVKVLGVVLLLLAALAVWKRDDLVRLQAVLTLFDAGQITGNFSHMDAAFLSVPVPKGRGLLAGRPRVDTAPGPTPVGAAR